MKTIFKNYCNQFNWDQSDFLFDQIKDNWDFKFQLITIRRCKFVILFKKSFFTAVN